MKQKSKRRVRGKRGETLTELVATIALLSILAGASVAVIGVVMQSFQTNTTMARDSQGITQAQSLLHHTAETAIGVMDAVPGTVNGGDRKLYVKEGRLVLSEFNKDTGDWEDFAPFDGMEKATFDLKQSGNSYHLDYSFSTKKEYTYTGGVQVNNMTAGTAFTGVTLVAQSGTPSADVIFFSMPKA